MSVYGAGKTNHHKHKRATEYVLPSRREKPVPTDLILIVALFYKGGFRAIKQGEEVKGANNYNKQTKLSTTTKTKNKNLGNSRKSMEKKYRNNNFQYG